MGRFREEDVEALGPDTFLSAFLVEQGARPAALLEPSDVGEARATDPQTAQRLQRLRAVFPSLILTPSDFGVWMSQHPVDLDAMQDDAARGNQLGYPCAEFFGQAENPMLPSMAFHVLVTYRKEPVGLLSNVCPAGTPRLAFDTLASRFRRALASDAWVASRFTRVRVTSQPNFPPLYLLNQLLSVGSSGLTSEEKKAIHNVLWNEFGPRAGDEWTRRGKTLLDWANPFHQGIVMSLLLQNFMSPLAPLYPLQLLPQGQEVLARLDRQGEEYVRLFQSTRMSSSSTKPRRTRRKR